MAKDAYLAEGSRPELERLRAVLVAAGIEARVGPPLAGCSPNT